MLQNILQEGEEWGIIALCSLHLPSLKRRSKTRRVHSQA
jgi:hypothetical protein